MDTAAYTPSVKQMELHASPANETLVGGAAGMGKSLSISMDPVQTQILGADGEQARYERGEIEESRGWAIHFRREFPRLEQTIARCQRIFRQLDPGIKWDANRHMFTWSCGFRYQFGHLAHDEDRYNYASNEYTHIGYDELWEIDYESYQFVNTRLRSSDPVLQRKLRIVAGSNPSGNWVRDYFVDPAPDGGKLLARTLLLDSGERVQRTRLYIKATLKDNPDPDFRRTYEIELQDKPAHIRRALLYADWYVVAGAFFAHEFTPAHVVEPFAIPSGWVRFRSMDWGYKSKGVVLWFAVDTDNNLVVYRELTFSRMDAGEVARKIRDIEDAAGEWDHKRNCSRLTGPADTQIWEQRGTLGPTIFEVMSLEGVDWVQATKNRHASVAQLLKRLKDRTGEAEVPAIRFFSNCKNTIRTIPAVDTDKTDKELPADGGEDHWLDTVLYGCMYRAATPKTDTLPWDQRYYDELQEARRRVAYRQRRGGNRHGYG